MRTQTLVISSIEGLDEYCVWYRVTTQTCCILYRNELFF